MKRRNFLKNAAATSIGLPLILNGQRLSAVTRHALFNAVHQDSDRVLVLIQMNGGNDGLNMVLPLDQYSNLFKARENILIPESAALKLVPKTGLHPSMTGMKNMFEEGKLCLVQSAGYPNQNRSHFRSTDIWQTGSAADVVLNTGWIGRYYDSFINDYPNGYPSAEYPDPFAITIGSIVSETCQGFVANYSMALENPFGLSPLLEDDDNGGDPNLCYNKEVSFVRTSISQTNAYASVISAAANAGTNLATYPDSRLAQQLKTIALLVSGGLKTKIYVANIGGFDTHANQVTDPTDTTTGTHANLLAQLSEAIAAFQADLIQQGLDKRVIGMTFSEFGRRILSNGANGTDHGSAAPLFVFGSCVNPTILGSNPTINDDVAPQEGVAMEHDFRSVYGSILKQWFEVPVDDVKALLYDDFSEMPIIEGCTSVNTEDPLLSTALQLSSWPNPFSDVAHVKFYSHGEKMRLTIFNAAGYQVALLADKYFNTGEHILDFPAGNLPSGNYFIHLNSRDRQQTISIVLKR